MKPDNLPVRQGANSREMRRLEQSRRFCFVI